MGSNSSINRSDPTGLESVGEMWFEDAVELQTEGKTVQAHLLIGTAILWEAFGAESLSKVADRLNRGKSEELSTGDYFGAGLDTGIGKGVKGLGKLGKSIGGFFSKGFEKFSGFFKTLRKNGDKVEEVVDAGRVAVDDLIKGSKTIRGGKKSPKSLQLQRSGGSDAANAAFDKLNLKNIQEKGNGVRGRT